MFTGITIRVGSRVSVAVALTGAAILHGGAASADASQDAQFLALLDEQGVPAVSGIPNLIKTAHEVCGELNGGVPLDTVVDEFEDYAKTVTPGADPGRVHRSAIRFVWASAGAYCPNHQVGFTRRQRSGEQVRLASFSQGADVANPDPPLPQVPDAHLVKLPQSAAPTPPKKAPPVVGPPPGIAVGGGGHGGGIGGAAPAPPPMEPGIIALAP
ncbi:DUF732 domain-containing protein [Mycobacterium conspicuum]|jgi:hypothetical protein|uniref:Uncharacterized protein n=1 Tax=Mycobacterium conspicuum TaxID=44010 RepID=A0A1X1T8X1_9MYCO|nr:DUF732 domain-containing protein [Mycobacterium conspicuum]ORV40958.1 hypothetical protein AWC00_15560 [Mycobacterium conspicuum]BBZ41272.1 hypothetical protein MCNS_43350 [Mycobacterium conspicuum]